jgi:amino acid transporter
MTFRGRKMELYAHILIQVKQIADPLRDKGLESAVSFAQSLSQWAYITVGASVALLLKDLTHRPKNRFARWSYLCFLPGWIFLGYAIYQGARVHGFYISYLFMNQHDQDNAILTVNADAARQLWALKWGLCIFFVWLVIYLLWWISHKDGSNPNESLNRP